MTTKVDIINNAYSQMRISGLTVNPSPEDLAIALNRLETMAEEFEGRNIRLGYNFETNPDPNSEHTISRKYWHAMETNLALRLLPDFGKEPTQILFTQAQSGLSFLAADTAVINPTPYPSRQPLGSGNRYRRRQRYFDRAVSAPNEDNLNYMYVDDINDFTEDFTNILIGAEVLSSYTIEADSGLTISNDTNTDYVVSYRITATGTDSSADNYQQVKIVATTDNSRVITRIINFVLTEVEID